MKKISILLSAAILAVATAASAEGISVTVNGKTVEFDQEPVIQNERTLVPLRAIFEAMGASVDWDSNTQTVTAANGQDTVQLTIGSKQITKNGVSKTLDVAPQIINERTLVPARAVAESFGSNVSWDANTQTVIITDTATTTPTTTPTATTATTATTTENIKYVWVGETGTKYHYESCPTLKGNGIKITLAEAEAEGRTPCKVCYK